MDALDLLIDLHLAHDRQGPGADDQTLRALAMAEIQPRADLAVADVGCGTGASALVLARALGTRVTAVDAAGAFIDRLRERASAAGLGGRIDARVGRMEALEFAEGSLDLIWSEGAIYCMGFEAGVRAWRRFLRPGGVLAVSELSWTTAERPAEIEAHWTREYPEVGTPSAKVRVLEEAGYAPMGFFMLPARCWEGYYGPIERDLEAFVARHGGAAEAVAIAEGERAEIDLYRRFGEWFGYGFYVARRV